ncbi:MAG: hypothetical protein CSA35_08910 [Dethiosulfovibrio peptidovorans]|nr:MAG: hypothetical protein CSA35_08910 [Dethiosulfovibrio peptidovorans]
MNTFVLLIRHAKPAVASGILYGSTDIPLSPEGVQEAKNLAPILGNLDVHQVLSSPLRRARSTAEATGLPPETIPGFREIHLGTWEMISSQDLKQHDPQAFQDRWKHLETFRPPGGESFQDLADRTIPALRQLVSSSDGVLVVFGHLGVFRAVLWRELNIPLKTTFSIAQDHCGIHVLEYGKAGVHLIRVNWRPSVI